MLLQKLMPNRAVLNSPSLKEAVPTRLFSKAKQKIVENSAALLSIAHKIMPTKVENYFVLHQVKRLSQPFMDDHEIDFLDDKVVEVEIRDLSAKWYFSKVGQQLVMMDKAESLSISSEPDVVFSASVDALVLMASQKIDPDTLFFNRKLKITGDTELGLEIKNLFDQFDLALLDKPFREVLDTWSDELISLQVS
ncbi:MAG: SCP2 sterol-binding domain-containing protein [Gammaproteobacteria bacterium]|nr:SCP2 sterol-binding domain-containing protein [Gammaproteobacteria bacterium]MBL4882778.1 SCP2 sterol-binding domain-containing protein [Oleispira sp.]